MKVNFLHGTKIHFNSLDQLISKLIIIIFCFLAFFMLFFFYLPFTSLPCFHLLYLCRTDALSPPPSLWWHKQEPFPLAQLKVETLVLSQYLSFLLVVHPIVLSLLHLHFSVLSMMMESLSVTVQWEALLYCSRKYVTVSMQCIAMSWSSTMTSWQFPTRRGAESHQKSFFLSDMRW